MCDIYECGLLVEKNIGGIALMLLGFLVP